MEGGGRGRELMGGDKGQRKERGKRRIETGRKQENKERDRERRGDREGGREGEREHEISKWWEYVRSDALDDDQR